MSSYRSTRREFLDAAGVAAATTIVAPYVKTAHSAGRLSLLLFDHWVPGVNEVMRRLIETWGRTNHVEVKVDFSNENIHVMAAEARARTGHDVMWFLTWEAVPYEHSLEPVDDVVEAITQEYGRYTENVEYTGRLDGVWRAVPDIGAQNYPLCSRLDRWREHAGIDLKELFPAGPRTAATLADWTYPAFLAACKKLHAAGHPFGDPIAPSEDTDQWLAPLFLSFGSLMVDERGELALDADETRAVLEYLKELAQYMPTEVYAWDNAGNNRWLISGRGSAIHNPPSAWAVAKRDAPEVAEQLWHHDVPRGPRGHFRGTMTRFWGIWEFSQNKAAAKDLLLHLSQREQAAELLWAAQGYDVPHLPAFRDLPIWAEAGPPAGTLYNYVIRGDEKRIVPGYPAPPRIAVVISSQSVIPNLVARVTQAGEAPGEAIAWAERELEGYLAR